MKMILSIICCFMCLSAILLFAMMIACIILSIKKKFCPRFPWRKM